MREIKRRIIELLDAQERKGIQTYGKTLEDAHYDDDGVPYDWNTMALEELVDALQYQIKQNLFLEHENEQAHQIIAELEHDLDNCDHQVREMLYNNRDDR
jgi:hypothetical protein